MIKLLSKFARDEAGATAIEYALIMIIVAAGIIASVTGMRAALVAIFVNVATQFTTILN